MVAQNVCDFNVFIFISEELFKVLALHLKYAFAELVIFDKLAVFCPYL